MVHSKICPTCGKSFFTSDKRRIRCSRACLSNDQSKLFRNRITLICEICKKPYEQKPSLAKISHFCSRICQNAALKSISTLTCKVCGKTFERIPSRKGDYCSYACMGVDSRVPHISKVCEVCEKPYQVQARYAEGSRYCSYECKYVGWTKTVRAFIGKRGPTRPEILVEKALNSLAISFEPEKPIGRYIIDFFLPDSNIAIEVDGDYWHSLPESKKRDKRKSKFLEANGYKVIRFTETEILHATSLASLVSERLS